VEGEQGHLTFSVSASSNPLEFDESVSAVRTSHVSSPSKVRGESWCVRELACDVVLPAPSGFGVSSFRTSIGRHGALASRIATPSAPGSFAQPVA
jgi:hypothetical protein